MSNILRFERLPTVVHASRLRVYPKDPGDIRKLAVEMARRGWWLEAMETHPAAALIYVR